MYETMRSNNEVIGNTFDCLYRLHIDASTISVYQYSKTGNIELLRFCRRPTTETNDMLIASDTTLVNGKVFSFDHLRQFGVTSRQLFDWYASMDTIEAYVAGEKEGTFYNCSRSNQSIWFGLKCQYTFDTNVELYNIIVARTLWKFQTADKILSFTNGTCYRMNDDECQSILCLDWREICDGKIDCANGLDERRCDELETNECDNTTEFRCQNGHCIDIAFYYDGEDDCMDWSDERSNRYSRKVCTFISIPDCEDRICPATWFSCGLGHCYDGPNVDHLDQCETQRDRLYMQNMPPSMFTLFSHVTLIYNHTRPEWICYNHTLCPHLSTNNYTTTKWQMYNNLVCRKFTSFINRTFKNLYDMIISFKNFVRSYAVPTLFQPSIECSMFSCGKSSQCLSYHRLSDGFKDCPNGEDEFQNNTCSYGIAYRYACEHSTKCIPQILLGDNILHCANGDDEYQLQMLICENQNTDPCSVYRGEPSHININFELICNGILDYEPDFKNNTDESDCSMNEWRCSNQFTKCDGIWNCLDGHDEFDCRTGSYLEDLCSRNSSHFCLNITTGKPFCLAQSKAGDNHIDCVGSRDERTFCRLQYPDDIMRRYRCQNSDVCISPLQVCDCHQDCPFNDDETVACHWLNNEQDPFCNPGYFRCRDGTIEECSGIGCRCDMKIRHCMEGEDELFCDLIDRTLFAPLKIDQLEEYPYVTHIKGVHRLHEFEGFIAWYCNSGLYVRSLHTKSGFYCLCPDYYYGDRCQYQRKRITFIIQPLITGSFTHLSIFKIIILLVRNNTMIVSHDQFFYIPQFQCLTKYFSQLLYPINESWLSPMNYSVHVRCFVAQTLEHCDSWEWDVKFNFLPVTRMVKRILIANTAKTIKPLSRIPYYGNCSSCSNFSICMGHDFDFGRDICICPINRVGRRCLIPFDPCTENSCNGHGQCVPIDVRFDSTMQYHCACSHGWFGNHCEKRSASIRISFIDGVKVPSFKTALIHLILPQFGPPHLTYFYRLNQDVSSYTLYLDGFYYVQGLVFIQLFENLNQFDIYMLAKHDNTYLDYESWRNISSEVHLSRRCRTVKELFNATVLAQSPLRRVKYFQQLCLNRISRSEFYCFYDEKLMCLCDKTNYANCFNFDAISFGCSWNNCSNRGKCVQNHARCPTSSLCLCEVCSYGSICQFTTNGYVMSLDAILGSHIRTSTPRGISHQTAIIQISVFILGLLITIGALLNILTIGTFVQKRTRRISCGWYLLISSFLSLFTMITLTCKIIILITTEQGSTSCLLIEFLLKWWPTSSEWLHACVAIERALAVIHQARYSNQASLRRVKWIVSSLLLLTAVACSPELIFRRIRIDAQDERIWCVFDLNTNKRIWQKMYGILNLLLFIIPLAINFITSIIIIMGTLHSKGNTIIRVMPRINRIDIQFNMNMKNLTPHHNANNKILLLKNRLEPIRRQIIKYKHILIAPALLGIFSTSRVVMAFTFVCTKLDQNPFSALLAYLIGFVPSMAILFVFVLPSHEYRAACIICIKFMIPKSIRQCFANNIRRNI